MTAFVGAIAVSVAAAAGEYGYPYLGKPLLNVRVYRATVMLPIVDARHRMRLLVVLWHRVTCSRCGLEVEGTLLVDCNSRHGW